MPTPSSWFLSSPAQGRTLGPPGGYATNAPERNFPRRSGRICLNLRASLRYLPPPEPVVTKLRTGERRPSYRRATMAKTGQDRAGRNCGIAAPRKARIAAGSPVESTVLRRYRHEDRRRRHLVLSKDPDWPASSGQAFQPRCSSARATNISWLPLWRKSASPSPMRRSSPSSSRSRTTNGGKSSILGQMSTTGWRPARATPCVSSRQADNGGLKPYLHVRRDLWAKVTRALFYDLVELGEERDGRRQGNVRRELRAASSCHGGSQRVAGVRLAHDPEKRVLDSDRGWEPVFG